MTHKLTGLWQNADFLRLWSGQTISVFGSMVGGTAMTFTAILTLHATPVQMRILKSMEIIPALAIGLLAGEWVDRLRRRPLMIGALEIMLAAITLGFSLLSTLKNVRNHD